MRNFELSGKRFSSLVVIEKHHARIQGHVQWRCLCDCGKETIVRAMCLTQGKTKSCGCLRFTRKSRLGDTRPCKRCGAIDRLKDRQCRPCSTLLGKAKAANRRARIAMATPPWADMNKIKEIYMNCPAGWHVDHIIPLKARGISGRVASGLHCEANLQYLPARDNQRKGCLIGSDN